jgi:hypothetical protein
MPEPMPLAINDHVRLRKPHPCGSYEWHIVRLGADIGLRCDGCGRKILLPRSEAERRIKKIIAHGQPTSQSDINEMEAL